MRVLREYECPCGNRYEGYHYIEDIVWCPCGLTMIRIMSLPRIVVNSTEKHVMEKRKDIEQGVFERQYTKTDEWHNGR